jgi:hypothetical protein
MDTYFNLMQIKSYYGGPVQTKTKFAQHILSEVATLNLSKISSVVLEKHWPSWSSHILLFVQTKHNQGKRRAKLQSKWNESNQGNFIYEL